MQGSQDGSLCLLTLLQDTIRGEDTKDSYLGTESDTV